MSNVGFSANPKGEFLPDGRKVRIDETFTYTRPNGDTITVPAGFVCDGASIPRIVWPLSGGPFEGKHRNAALVHDWLYYEQATDSGPIPRGEADAVFYEAMRLSGVNLFHARSKHWAVYGWQQARHGNSYPRQRRDPSQEPLGGRVV